MIFCFQPGVWHFLGDSAPLRPCVEEHKVSTCPDLLQYPLRLREAAFASVKIVDWPLLPKHGYPPLKAGKFPRGVSGRPVSRILSREETPLGGHLSGQPTRNSRETGRLPPRRASFLLGLAPDGGCLAADVTTRAGGLLHHLFTITAPPAVCFCGPIREVAPSRDFPGVVPCGVRTFLDAAQTAPRPPGQPETLASYLFVRCLSNLDHFPACG